MKKLFLTQNKLGCFFIMLALFISWTVFSSCSSNNDEHEENPIENIEYTLTLDKNTESIVAGKELTITPVISNNAKNFEYSWTSSNNTVATVLINNDKSVTIKALTPGTTKIEIKGPEGKNITASCIVTVTAKTFKILAIGNSFSQDAVEQYLYELAAVEGFKPVIGNMYIGGCSLERHVSNANNNSAAYEYRKIVDGKKTNKLNVTLAEALADESWDYISLQQVSGNSGQYETYVTSLPELVNYVKSHSTNKDMKLMLHQTWAYATNSTHADFPKYDKDQVKMYNAIIDAVEKASKLVNIDIIIPSGAAIQNGRTSYIGDNFNRDGYHLELTYGRYTAACTWFEKIFNKTVVGNTYFPTTISEYNKQIAQNAAHYAVLNPNVVTDLVAFKNEEEEKDNDKILQKPILIDFGSVVSASPWNNVTSVSSMANINLFDSEGSSTGIKIHVSNSFGGINTVGETTTTTIWNMPESVSKDSFWGNTGESFEGKNEKTGGFIVSTLNKKMKYSFTFFSSRTNSSNNRETQFTVTGKTNSGTVTLDASLNKTKTVTVENIEPDNEGKVSISVTSGSNNNNVNGFFHVNGLIITPVQ